ncbi:ATP-binding protein [Saccharothrix yanglingensis]|uniref:ATP-binding protein n=1 Tax=Saccharothrix yanglingensis TaxID=659496 RepID=A0ABU0WV32_9PSEU|nr:ATP-binding protein [Saccharothrix yanglingensis]
MHVHQSDRCGCVWATDGASATLCDVDLSLSARPAEFAVPRGPGAASGARDFVRGTLLRRGFRGDHEDVVLLASELVANVLRHTASEPVVRLVGDARSVRVEVFDASPLLPCTRVSGPSGGWGLVVVARLARRWGVDPRPDGKVVWFELDAEVGAEDDPAA